jgi:hypothetical protein
LQFGLAVPFWQVEEVEQVAFLEDACSIWGKTRTTGAILIGKNGSLEGRSLHLVSGFAFAPLPFRSCLDFHFTNDRF